MKRSRGNTPKRNRPAVQYKKDLGQHFLYDAELLQTLVREANVTAEDHILEIGAGAGTLTRALCETGAQVAAVEVDQALLPVLMQMREEFKNLTIIQSDIRKLNLQELPFSGEYSIVANIPYSITSQILDMFWGKDQAVRRMSVMVQKEVADKLIAQAGDQAYGLMSVRCRYYCVPRLIAQIPAEAFTPSPKVDSAFVSLMFRAQPPLPVEDEKLLWRLINASYTMRRKTMQNALKGVLPISAEALQGILQELGLSATVRGETFSVEQWIEFANAVAFKSRFPSSASERC